MNAATSSRVLAARTCALRTRAASARWLSATPSVCSSRAAAIAIARGASHHAKIAVEAELTGKFEAFQPLRRKLAARYQNADGNRQIKPT